MRRTVKKNTPKVKSEALAQLRKVRAQFEEQHPDLLERMKREIEKQQLYNAFPGPQDVPVEETANAMEPIDKKKNLLAVMKLLQQGSGSADFQAALKKTLMGVLH